MAAVVSPRILVVDDDREFRRSLIKIFQKAGFQVNVASNGDHALSLLNRTPFTLVILDLKMPGKSGVDLLHEIKLKAPRAKIIVITAFDDAISQQEVKAAGVFDCLSKPAKRQTILETTKRALAEL